MTDVPTVLVTGANSGVGLAAVEAIARRGANVVATARRPEDAAMVRSRLGALGTPVTTDLLDVLDVDMVADVVRRHRPDVVVNNAGDAELGAVLEVDDDDAARQFATHVIAPMRLARLAVPHMEKRGGGRIVNVSSALASTALPLTGWYGAAKAALSSLTDTLRVELADAGITVVLVDLGAVDTPAWRAAADEMGAGDVRSRRWAAITARLRPLFGDVAAAGEAVASAACDPEPRWRYQAGFGARVLTAAQIAPRPVRDLVLDTIF